MTASDTFAAYVREYDQLPALKMGEDWRFELPDLRDAAGTPLNIEGYEIAVQFRPATLRGMLIDTLNLTSGITVTPGQPGFGPDLTILSRACNRAWAPLIDTPVVADVMLYKGEAPNRDSIFVMRLSFVASWSATHV